MRLRKGEFSIIPFRAATDVGCDSYELATYAAICKYANESGRCWPSLSRLQRDTKQSRARLLKSIAGLEVKGLLSRAQRMGPDGSLASNMYEVLIPEVVHEADHPSLPDRPPLVCEADCNYTNKNQTKEQYERINALWKKHTMGDWPRYKFPKSMFALIDEHGLEAIEAAFDAYLMATEAKYRSMMAFIRNPAPWIKVKKEVDYFEGVE